MASVMVDQVTSLIAYDVQLHYNGAALHASAPDFSGPFAGSGCMLLPLVESVSDALGTVRAAVTTFSGCSVDVTGPTPIFTVTFTVAARLGSPLHISTDSQCACSALVQISPTGAIVPVAHTATDGTFFAEPNVLFQKTFNVTSAPRNPLLVGGKADVVLSSGLVLPRGENLVGFAYVVFTIITPTGKVVHVQSNEAFLLIGDTPTVMATYTATQMGTFEMFGTLWRGSGPNPPAIVPFITMTGQTFRVR